MSRVKGGLPYPCFDRARNDRFGKQFSKEIRTVVLFSGGLDSILATKILQSQNIYVEGLFFASLFWKSEGAKTAAERCGVKLNIIKLGDDYLKIIKKPRFGRGKGMNPCLDCRIFMLKKAKEFIRKKKFDFVATGEVLGQRPLTQNKKALEFTERTSGLSGALLRPLSAKLLTPTKLEKERRILREKFFDIQGRSRQRQMDMANRWGIREYPSPAGGCLLTDLEFSKRIRELFEKHPRCSAKDVELLKLGRHFWIDKTKIIVGRNKEENERLEKLADKEDTLIELKDFTGPLVLIRGKTTKKILEKAGFLTANYSTKAKRLSGVKIEYWRKDAKRKKIIIVK